MATENNRAADDRARVVGDRPPGEEHPPWTEWKVGVEEAAAALLEELLQECSGAMSLPRAPTPAYDDRVVGAITRAGDVVTRYLNEALSRSDIDDVFDGGLFATRAYPAKAPPDVARVVEAMLFTGKRRVFVPPMVELIDWFDPEIVDLVDVLYWIPTRVVDIPGSVTDRDRLKWNHPGTKHAMAWLVVGIAMVLLSMYLSTTVFGISGAVPPGASAAVVIAAISVAGQVFLAAVFILMSVAIWIIWVQWLKKDQDEDEDEEDDDDDGSSPTRTGDGGAGIIFESEGPMYFSAVLVWMQGYMHLWYQR